MYNSFCFSVIPDRISTAPRILDTHARHYTCLRPIGPFLQSPDLHRPNLTIRQRNKLIAEIGWRNRIRCAPTRRRLVQKQLLEDGAGRGEREGRNVASETGLVPAVCGPEVRTSEGEGYFVSPVERRVISFYLLV
jgi:hypothetical protein